jgi:phosphosulfolactate phosphohydrolase-like enzyme
MPSATAPISAAYVISTICSAIPSSVRIMNVAIAMIRIGAAVVTNLPVGVSPIVLFASATTAVETAPATRKIRTAAITWGRYP